MVRIFEIFFLRHQLLANIRGIPLVFLPDLARTAMFYKEVKVQKEQELYLLKEKQQCNKSHKAHVHSAFEM